MIKPASAFCMFLGCMGFRYYFVSHDWHGLALGISLFMASILFVLWNIDQHLEDIKDVLKKR